MGMGVVDSAEFEKQLENTTKPYKNDISIPDKPVIEGTIIDTPSKGRDSGDVNVPESMRNLIADEAHSNGRKSALELAKSFGISSSSVSAYTNGASSTKSYNEPKKGISNVIARRKRINSKKALNVLENALTELTPDRISDCKTRDIAAIAKDMASVIRIMEPESGNQSGPLVSFNLFTPPVRHEDSYESVQVSE